MAFFSSFTSFFNSFYPTNSSSNEDVAMEKKKLTVKMHQNGSIIQRRKMATINHENGHTQNGLEKRFLGSGTQLGAVFNNSSRFEFISMILGIKLKSKFLAIQLYPSNYFKLVQD